MRFFFFCRRVRWTGVFSNTNDSVTLGSKETSLSGRDKPLCWRIEQHRSFHPLFSLSLSLSLFLVHSSFFVSLVPSSQPAFPSRERFGSHYRGTFERKLIARKLEPQRLI
ncbi:hypothetical protein PUN28_016351 [Cardiocondyla obscurior]|uniref:Uncharacterized protein n=1 Tax=Cardiocondyla obscurior TaxID=286306 RepID=A0AAW2EUJ1_9HYME